MSHGSHHHRREKTCRKWSKEQRLHLHRVPRRRPAKQNAELRLLPPLLPFKPIRHVRVGSQNQGPLLLRNHRHFLPFQLQILRPDVKKLRDLNPQNFCGVDVYNGFLVRFIKASAAYLGQAEDSVVVDFNYYRADEASSPRLYQDVWEEVEQMAFFKYGARPHWAKNRKAAFLGVRRKYSAMDKFDAVKKKLDPTGMFSSEWSDEIILGEEKWRGDGCALEFGRRLYLFGRSPLQSRRCLLLRLGLLFIRRPRCAGFLLSVS